jgi:hypothetical protein
MDKLYPKARSHSLDAPDGPLAKHLAAFEGHCCKNRWCRRAFTRDPKLMRYARTAGVQV